MADTNISWCDKVWNPVVGCSRVSSGCERCYAEAFAARLEAMGQARYKGLTVIGKQGARWTGEVRPVPEVLAAPLTWKKPRRIFVNSMSDLFHEKLPFEWIAAVFGVMAATPWHTYLVLTKRPESAFDFFERLADPTVSNAIGETRKGLLAADLALHGMHNRVEADAWPLPNVHLGVSVEDQTNADKRIPILRKCPASVHWISAEPLLGPIVVPWLDALVSGISVHSSNRVSWCVAGGESGPDRRACEPAWIDSLVAQCSAAGVPIFVKQDSGPKPGRQGRLSDATWAHKEFPRAVAA